MEWSERMNAAIDYIEANLSDTIDVNIAADKALCSSFHFQRMFYVVTGTSLGEYVRRRRLTLAATELSLGDNKVIDIALKYGYDSPTAFSRAFRQVHGISPQEARKRGVKLVAFPRVSFHISLKGGDDMDYKIIEKPDFDLIGKSRKFTTKQGENLIKIPQFWTEFEQSTESKVLFNLNEGKPGPMTGAERLGVCFGYHGMEDFRYGIAVEKIHDKVPAGFEVIHIPMATWAVFDGKGALPNAIQSLNKSIWEEWFPSTGFESGGTVDFEVMFPGDVDSPDYHFQVWVPVKRGKKTKP